MFKQCFIVNQTKFHQRAHYLKKVSGKHSGFSLFYCFLYLDTYQCCLSGKKQELEYIRKQHNIFYLKLDYDAEYQACTDRHKIEPGGKWQTPHDEVQKLKLDL